MRDGRFHARAVRGAVPCILAVAAAMMPIAASAQSAGSAQPQVSATKGVGTAPAPRLVDLSAVPQVTAPALAAMAARPQPPRPQNGLSDQQYAAFKAAAAARRFNMPNATPLSPPAVPSAGSAAEGILTPNASLGLNGNTETACGNAIPSDMGLAVGGAHPIVASGSPASVLQVTNACISVFDKLGNLQPGFPKSIDAFLGAPAGANIFDPRALYDWVNHRYILSFAEFDNNVGTYWVAVSQGDDPRSGYHVYHINSPTGGTNIFLDFPRLGQDRQAIYVASNKFDNTTKAFLGEEWLLLPKQAMYAGQALGTFNVVSGPAIGTTLLDSTQPANIWGLTDNPRAEFLVGSLNFNFGGGLCSAGCASLVVWAISNPLSALGAEVTGVVIGTVNIYSLPPGAVQKGTATLIDTGDVRITGEVSYAAGSLYAALTTANGAGGADVILYRLAPILDDGSPACSITFACADITDAGILNETVLDYSATSGTNAAFYPTPQPDPEGNVTTVFNFSGPNDFASTFYISQRATQAPGTFRDSGVSLAPGGSAYAQGCSPTGTMCRWGDYTGVAPSGINGNSPTPQMWFAGMFADGSGKWATKIGRNGFTAPNQP